MGCLVLGAAFAAGALLGSPVIGGFWFLASGGTLIWRTAIASARAPIMLPALVLVLGVSTESVDPDNAAMIVGISGSVAIVGLGWVRTHQRAERVEARAAQVVGVQQVAARAAVFEERRRMSRELHDVLSHAITIMVVQSGAARALSLPDPVRSRTAIDEVITTADRALVEVDLLGRLIEAGAAGTAGLGPGETTRTEKDLADLVDRMRAAGLDVVVDDSDSAAGTLPAAVGPCVYRIAQEGLTNVLRHAPGARVVVGLRIIDDHLEVTVDDDGGTGGSSPEPTSHRGFGLVWLGERVTALGGTLHTAALRPRGFQIAAQVPLSGAATAVMR
jgi:signal transduction histidine kinase